MVSLCMIIIDGISVHLGVMASLGASQLKKKWFAGAMDFFCITWARNKIAYKRVSKAPK